MTYEGIIARSVYYNRHNLDQKVMDLLTVILITYNHKHTFKKAIESVLAQKTDFGFQVYVLDDCSSDGTSEIVRKYARKYPQKIKAFIRKENIGLVENIFSGIQAVKTKYFAFLESDDYWCDQAKLQLQVDSLEKNPNCSYCGHNTAIYANGKKLTLLDGRLSLIEERPKSFRSKYSMPSKFCPHTSSRVFRTSVIDFEKLKDKKSIVYDYCLHWYFLSKGQLFYINKVMSVYNLSDASSFATKSAIDRAKIAFGNVLCINRELSYKWFLVFGGEIIRLATNWFKGMKKNASGEFYKN